MHIHTPLEPSLLHSADRFSEAVPVALEVWAGLVTLLMMTGEEIVMSMVFIPPQALVLASMLVLVVLAWMRV